MLYSQIYQVIYCYIPIYTRFYIVIFPDIPSYTLLYPQIYQVLHCYIPKYTRLYIVIFPDISGFTLLYFQIYQVIHYYIPKYIRFALLYSQIYQVIPCYIPRYTRLYIVIFPDIPGGGRKTAPNYNVVKTDYESYAVVYNCNQYPLIKTESLWLLTREQNPSQELVEQLYSEMREMGLPVDSFYKTEQSNCTQLPEPGTVQYKFSPESLG
ncbi:uncharacterized protein LOC111704458 isoform X2 [Eurytemora carolleeae]|uniref:uncharacterized protein LOC111704458 isoform X2 n=1 Tax=Eurytemora carolleeae TaxID=1294199 RepID=UPI000C761A5E|nr:uncharacterized protein LOC111704458 isoform X2 [Eurytemora carolleeae]|eukprot:XP_023332464.1 uncharacterized protein LOC111704458 isoform X2 [Eurytemora affinis]